MSPREDPLRRLLREDDERRAHSPAENGCPYAVEVNGEQTCSRSSKQIIENARLRSRLGQLAKAAETAAFAASGPTKVQLQDLRAAVIETRDALHETT